MTNETELLEVPSEAGTGETPPADPSLRDSIEAAIEEHSEPETPESKPAGTPETPATPADQTSAVRQEGQAAPPAPGVPTPGTQAAQAAPTELKAPSQWRPQVREKWNALPREVQEEVHRREGDMMRLVGAVGGKIRFADEVTNHIQPFAERLEANGVAPSAFIGDIFTSVRSLAGGTPQQKAEVVANIVQSYGVDLRTLDAILTQRIHQPAEVGEARRQMARAQSILQQNQAMQQQQTAAEVEKSISAFGADPKHEFFADVRELMADLVETGRAKDLEEAYSAAVWANPDTRKILLQREAEQRLAVKNKRATLARNASASVNGAPRGVAGAPVIGQDMSLRDTIAAAMDAHESA